MVKRHYTCFIYMYILYNTHIYTYILYTKTPYIVSYTNFMYCSYTKPKGQLPDYTSPVVLKSMATTVENFCIKIHKSIIKDFKQ